MSPELTRRSRSRNAFGSHPQPDERRCVIATNRPASPILMKARTTDDGSGTEEIPGTEVAPEFV